MFSNIARLSLALTVLLSGCSSFTSPARVHTLGDGNGYWFDYDASRRGTILVSQDPITQKFSYRSCAEPAPDVALNLASKIESQISYSDISGQAKSDLAINAVKLADRSQMVQFFREALFRLCEISINQSLRNEDVTALYTRIIDTALRLGSEKAIDADILALKEKIAEREAAISTAAATRAQAEAEKAKSTSDAEKQQYQKQIESLNTQIAKAGEEKKMLATQLLTANQLKKNELDADNSKAISAQQKGDEVSRDPSKAQPPLAAQVTK